MPLVKDKPWDVYNRNISIRNYVFSKLYGEIENDCYGICKYPGKIDA